MDYMGARTSRMDGFEMKMDIKPKDGDA